MEPGKVTTHDLVAAAAGFVACLVLTWLHKAFSNWVFGSGVLPGQSRAPNAGFFVQTSRGFVHYVFLDRSASAPAEAAQQAASFAPPLPGRASTATSFSSTSTLEHHADSGSFGIPLLSAAVGPDDGGEQPAAVDPARVSGQELKYGQIHGELVVIVHGFAGSNDAFVSDSRAGYASWLNRNGFCVLAVDLYGYGHSDGPDTSYSSELFVEQLAELCLIFGISEPFDLIGFSMGGSVALQFAYRYGNLVKRLILQAPHIVEAPLRPSLQVALRIPFFREILSYFIISYIGECGHNKAALRASFRLLLTRLKGGGRWSSPGKGGSTKQMLREMDASGRIIYFLWGRRDSVVQWRQSKTVKKLAPNSRLVTHPTADHMTFADGDPDTRDFFRMAVLHFLCEHHPM